MISRPTTAQILDDCARELRETVAPVVQDPTVRIRLEMMEQLLASCAVRAAHEIAWMAAECDAMERFATDVAEVVADDQLTTRLAACRDQRTANLDLEDRIADYDRAGRAFAVALELAMRNGHDDLAARARTLIEERRDRETATRPGFYLPGRE